MGTIAEKLTYLNTTKEKIKDSINLTGANLTSEDTFRSYATKLNKGYIDIINNGIDTLYNNFPKVSEIGSNLSLTPTYEAPIKLNEIQGDTLQDGTPTPDTPVEIENVTGLQNINVANATNIFDMKKYASENSNYFTYSIETGLTAILKDNRATANVGFSIEVSPNTTYYVKTDTDKRLLVAQYNSNDGWIRNNEVFNGNSFTTNSNTSYLRIKVADTLTTFPTVVGNVYISTSNDYKGNTYEVNLGKNLLDESKARLGTFNGLTISYSNGEILLNGTATALVDFYVATKVSTPTYNEDVINYMNNNIGAYTLSNNLGFENYFRIGGSYPQNTGTTTSTNKVDLIFVRIPAGTYNNQVLNIQLEKGTQSTSFSPYFTPIELNKIGNYQDSIKKSTGKNLFDKDNVNTINGYFTGSGTTTITGHNSHRIIYIPCNPNTTYTVQKLNEGSNKRFALATSETIPTINGTIMQSTGQKNNQNSLTITTNSTANYLLVWCYVTNDEQVTWQQIIDSIQIEENSQATSYEPYGKVWYVEKKIGKVVLDGSETYSSGSTNTSGVYRIRTTAIANLIKAPSSAGVNGDALSNYFGITTANQNYQCVQGFGVETSGALVFYDSGGNTQTTSAFTTWLASNNMTIYYALNTPTYTEITNTELINQLEELYTAKSQEGTTNISITSEDLEMILNVSALKGEE